MDTHEDLAGRVALVTGGSRGIGLAVARALVERRVHVGLVARTEADLASAAGQLEKLDAGKVRTATAELEDPAQAVAAADRIASGLGPIDFLVSCAGRADSAPFVRTELAALQGLLNANLITTWNAMQSVLPGMVKRGFGRVVNVASLAGMIGYRYVAAYCAAKHAVVGLTRAVALEVASAGVTVNAVWPWLRADADARALAREHRGEDRPQPRGGARAAQQGQSAAARAVAGRGGARGPDAARTRRSRHQRPGPRDLRRTDAG
jgi:NAD(P)-dependent dehydrogenase (short-subunit alcohol dehydrogenase family)